MTQSTRLVVVGDIHCGPDQDTQLGSRAPELLDGVVAAARAFRAHGIVDLGDRINPVAHAQDRARTAYVRRRLLEAGVPVYHVLGNTDVANLEKHEVCRLLGKTGPYEIAELNGWRLVLLDSVDPPVERVGGAVGEAQRAWLADATRGARPCLVFSHHPLAEQPLEGHRYFTARPHLAGVRGAEDLRPFLDRPDVRAVFAGHLHWTRTAAVGGTCHVTLASLVDCAYTGGEAANAYALVTAGRDGLDVTVAGLMPAALSVPA
jgi:Icc protein